MGLTSEQMAVVEHDQGHALVSAVAGSGKSTAIAHRVKRLVERGCKSEHILVVMFNRDARDDFDGKLQRLMGNKHRVRVGTFHRLGNQLIKQLEANGKLAKGVLEANEYKHYKFVRQFLEPIIKKQKGLSWKPTFTEFFRFIDLVKADLAVPPLKVFERYHFDSRYRFFLSTFQQYEDQRKRDKLRFFSDLIFDPMVALQEDPGLVSVIADQFDHVIVDEFQDINAIQYDMIKKVAGSRAQIMTVGDADQCIYAWRGANPEFIQSIFSKDFHGTTLFSLSFTFRYGHKVSLAANHVIRHNRGRPADKLCISHPSAPTTVLDICVEQFNNARVVEILQEWFVAGGQPSAVGVLLRNFGLSLPLEIALLQAGISYKMVGGTRAFELPELSSLIAGLYIACGRFEQLEEFARLKLIRPFLETSSMGLSPEEVNELARAIAREPAAGPDHLAAQAAHAYRGWSARKLEARSQLWRNLESAAEDPLTDTIDYLYERLDMDAHIDFSARSPEVAEDLRRLFESFGQYAAQFDGGILDFVFHIEELLRASDTVEDDRSILLTSIHRAKGREWPLVIIPSLYHGALPHIPKGNKIWSMEEERRLFYVAITRAVERCVLLCPDDRELQKWLSHGCSGNPLVDEANTDTGSAFLYESNLYLAQMSEQLLAANQAAPAGVKCTEVYDQYHQQLEALCALENT